MLSQTKKALEEFDNQHDFERMCADILNSLGYRDVVLVAPKGGADEGKDITFTTEDGEKGLACVTLQKDIDKKFIEDFTQRKKGEYQKYYFFTNQYLTNDQKKRYIRHCLEILDAQLVPQDIEALRSLLDSSLKDVRKRCLYTDKNALLHVERDLNISHDLIGEQNITNNFSKDVQHQPIIEVQLGHYTSAQGKYTIALILRNIGNSPGIVYDLQLAGERLEIAHITLPPHGELVTLNFDISSNKVLLEKIDNPVLIVFYKSIYNEYGKTIAKVIQTERADMRFNISRLEIEEYITPDKEPINQGSIIIVNDPLDIWNKKF